MTDNLPRYIQAWLRELLGARGYLRALNDPATNAKIMGLAKRVERGELDRSSVSSAFAKAVMQKVGLDELLDEFEEMEQHSLSSNSSSSASSASTYSKSNSSAASSVTTTQRHQQDRDSFIDLQLKSLRQELIGLRRHNIDLETLVRELTHRSVVDATRIRGLETVSMILAESLKSENQVADIYEAVTAEFIQQRAHQFRKRAYSGATYQPPTSPTSPTTSTPTKPGSGGGFSSFFKSVGS